MSVHVIVIYRQQNGQKLGQKTTSEGIVSLWQNQSKSRSVNYPVMLVTISMIYRLHFKGHQQKQIEMVAKGLDLRPMYNNIINVSLLSALGLPQFMLFH